MCLLVVLNVVTYKKIHQRILKVAQTAPKPNLRPEEIESHPPNMVFNVVGLVNNQCTSTGQDPVPGYRAKQIQKLITMGASENNQQNQKSNCYVVTETMEGNSIDVYSNRMRSDKNKKVSRRGSSKAAKSLSIVVIVFVLFWMPYCLVNVIGNFLDNVNETVYDIVDIFLWTTTIWNPIIYFATNEVMRTKYQKMCPCKQSYY